MMDAIYFYLLSFIALAIGTAGVYLPLAERVPIRWVYWHYFIRKPVNWTILCILVAGSLVVFREQNHFPIWAIAPLVISVLSMVLTYKLHPTSAFKAIDFPQVVPGSTLSWMDGDIELAVIEYEGITKCYPLDYVIHHHIVNDRFNSKTIALTYCALCRSVIPFDVTDLGPLFVASMKNANMIVGDRRTKTFFQQGTFKSIIGKLHPSELRMVHFQILTWAEVQKTIPDCLVVKITESDFRDFKLPVPGVWKRVMASEFTPGLSKKNRDKSFPARTRVIGIIDPSIKENVFYLKKEVMATKLVVNEEFDFFLIGGNKTVKAFKSSLNDSKLNISIESAEIIDLNSNTRWDIRGKFISGALNADLEKISISDEYWFSWARFHPNPKLIAL